MKINNKGLPRQLFKTFGRFFVSIFMSSGKTNKLKNMFVVLCVKRKVCLFNFSFHICNSLSRVAFLIRPRRAAARHLIAGSYCAINQLISE